MKKSRKTHTRSIRFTEDQITLCETLDIDISKTCRDAIEKEIKRATSGTKITAAPLDLNDLLKRIKNRKDVK